MAPTAGVPSHQDQASNSCTKCLPVTTETDTEHSLWHVSLKETSWSLGSRFFPSDTLYPRGGSDSAFTRIRYGFIFLTQCLCQHQHGLSIPIYVHTWMLEELTFQMNPGPICAKSQEIILSSVPWEVGPQRSKQDGAAFDHCRDQLNKSPSFAFPSPLFDIFVSYSWCLHFLK